MQLRNACLLLAIIICLGACKGKDLNPLSPITTQAEWDVNGEHYKGSNLALSDNSMESTSSAGYNSLNVRIGAKLTTTTSLKVVAYTLGTLQANELCMNVEHGKDQHYYSTGNDNKTITVTVTNGNYSIEFDKISLRHYTGNTVQNDSTTTTGYMKRSL